MNDIDELEAEIQDQKKLLRSFVEKQGFVINDLLHEVVTPEEDKKIHEQWRKELEEASAEWMNK